MASRLAPIIIHTLLTGSAIVAASTTSSVSESQGDNRTTDACALIGGKKWVAPAEVRECFASFPMNETIRTNILDVVTRMLAIHTSTNYQAAAPGPFSEDVKEDLLASLARIRVENYTSLFDMHVDLSDTVKRARDGHLDYSNYCFDSLYLSYLPIPLSHVNGSVIITPEAYSIAQTEYPDQVEYWNSQLPTPLMSLSGAKVISIDGMDPWAAAEANAKIAGTFQSKATRESAFFSSYVISSPKWTYRPGDFAQLSLPLKDQVRISLRLVNGTTVTNLTIPYRSRFSAESASFTGAASLWSNNCVAQNTTNGRDMNNIEVAQRIEREEFPVVGSRRFQYPMDPQDWKQPLNEVTEKLPLFDIGLPAQLSPPTSLLSRDALFFYMLNDNQTGVLALGSFIEGFTALMRNTSAGLTQLVEKGATQLLVDVTNNGGGILCLAHWLHRVIAGPSSKSEPQALLNTQIRAGPLARAITAAFIADVLGADSNNRITTYRPGVWNFGNHTSIPLDYNILDPGVSKVVNGRQDRFSEELGQECHPYLDSVPNPPDKALFDPSTKVAILSNGRCGSACALFTVAMNKHYGTPTVVTNGRPGITQQYGGMVGGQSLGFPFIQSEAKTTKQTNHSEFPPDFITNSALTITWRLSLGIDDPTQPEEWQSRPATYNFQHKDLSTINNPLKLWESVAELVFGP